MQDKSVSATTVIATAMWVVGGLMTLVELFTRLDIGSLGIVIAAGGATLNVRRFFCQLAERDRNAFELGRDYASSHEGGVTSIR